MSDTVNNNWMAPEYVRQIVVERAIALGITGTPDVAAHNLGQIQLSNGEFVTAHVIHAVDPIITDGTSVVLIKRKNPPGQGRPGLPGGFIDPIKGGAESAIQAAAREALEEVGAKLDKGILIGTRNMNRPHDVRRATCDLPQYGIKQGDIFMVSTQAVRFDVPDLKALSLNAGSDAIPGSARPYLIAELTRDTLGIPDHYDMIMQALAPASPSPLPTNRTMPVSQNPKLTY